MDRYNFGMKADESGEYPLCSAIKSTDGQFVKYSDVLAELSALKDRAEKAEELVSGLRQLCKTKGDERDTANATIAKMRDSVIEWCKDCELQSDCIAPNLKPCTLKTAYKTALKQIGEG